MSFCTIVSTDQQYYNVTYEMFLFASQKLQKKSKVKFVWQKNSYLGVAATGQKADQMLLSLLKFKLGVCNVVRFEPF